MKKLFIFLACSSWFVAHAQQDHFQWWPGIEGKYSYKKLFNVSLEELLRMQVDPAIYDITYTDVGVDRDLVKNLDLALRYRLIVDEYSELTNRLYGELSYDWKKKNLSITPRIRYQWQTKNVAVANSQYIRPKLTFEYRVKKDWQPFISGELFYHFLYYKGSVFDETRLSAGLSYDFSKHQSVKGYYIYDREFNVIAPALVHVAGITFTYKI